MCKKLYDSVAGEPRRLQGIIMQNFGSPCWFLGVDAGFWTPVPARILKESLESPKVLACTPCELPSSAIASTVRASEYRIVPLGR